MSVLGLDEAGRFLFGDTTVNPGWLQNTLSSVSSQGDFMCLAKGQNFILVRSNWSGDKLELKQVHRDTVSVLQEDEEITSVVVFPVYSQGRVQSIAHSTVLGFNSGIVRVYTESGQLIVQKCFHPAPVRHIKFQSMPEGKHCSNILFTQTMQELLVVYESVLVSIPAVDLLETISRNIGELANTMARGLETVHLTSLKAQILGIKNQKVADCESFVFTNTSYNQYYQLTMQGGNMDERYKPVTTKPYFLTVGQDPFLQYNEKATSGPGSAGALAQNMVSTVKSGFFRVASGALGNLWSGQGSEEVKEPPPDPLVHLSISHSLKDKGRDGSEVLISPNKMYSAVKDSQNRILLVDNYTSTVLQIWRGYHRCQMGWALAYSQKLTDPSQSQVSQDVASVLILYLPRRGLIEVWSPEQKVKVTEFHVSKHGTLLRSAGVCLDDGLPRRRDTVRVFTSFLQPSGRISHFFIPFHALSISSTAEKDINAQHKIQELVKEKPNHYMEEVLKLMDEIRNIQMKNSAILQILSYPEEEKLSPAESLELVTLLLNSSAVNEKSQSLEQKLYISRLTKLKQLIRLYCVFEDNKQEEKELESDDWTVENLAIAFSLPETDVAPLFSLIKPGVSSNKTLNMFCSDFIQCFDIEGELGSGDRSTIRLRKDLSPRIQPQLLRLFCRISSEPGAKEKFLESGISPCEILETILVAFMRNSIFTIDSLFSIQQCFLVLLGLREGSDDRTISALHDVSKRILLKVPISTEVYTLIFLWRHCLRRIKSSLSYVDDWTRRLYQVSSLLEIYQCVLSLAGEELILKYTIHDVFDNGNGRVAELVSKWLLKLGSNSLNLTSNIEGFTDTKDLTLVTKVSLYFPRSMDCNILLVHMCWEELQRWQRDRDDVQLLETSIMSLSSLSCPSLRIQFSNLIWRSFFSKLFRDLAKRTDEFKKTTCNEKVVCEKEFGLQVENIPSLLNILLGFIDKTLDLMKHVEPGEIICDYDSLNMNKHLHLLDHIKNTGFPDPDILSLEHQVAAVLFLTWKLKLPVRPLKVFNSVEINNLLSIQSAAMISWFSDYNASVKKERLNWTELVTDTSTGYIHRVSDNQLDTEQYRHFYSIILQLGKIWFMSEEVRVYQCLALFKAGFDSLGAELRSSIGEKEKIAVKLLEVALLRLAKYLYQVSDPGRLAAVSSDLITELAARRSLSGNVADSSLAETLALFLWLTETLENQELQLLSTQAVAAVQVLQVRKNRLGE